MATMIVKIRVTSFDHWKRDFDANASLREKHGWLAHRVVRDAIDPNVVTVLSRVRALSSAKEYAQSPALREAMQRSGVEGPPEVSFCEDDAEATYPIAPVAPVTLHVFPRSTSCRPVLLFCAESKIPFELVTVDLMAGAQDRHEFAELNPARAVPVLVDGAMVLTESSAIIQYLADRSALPTYPADRQRRARIHERMSWVSASFLPQWCQGLIYPQTLPHYKRDSEVVQAANLEWSKKKCEQLLGVLDAGLIGSNPYIAGNELSIADYFAATAVWTGTLVGARFGAYPNVERWLATIRALPSWAKVHEGVDAAAASMKNRHFVTIGA